jgi:hypothetical protein
MGKPSRRQRKQLHVKRVRSDGTIAHSGSKPAASVFGKAEPRQLPSIGEEQRAAAAAKDAQGWSSWPASLKLILAGILVLIVIGFYRRYSEDWGTREIGSPEPPARATPAPAQALAKPEGLAAGASVAP